MKSKELSVVFSKIEKAAKGVEEVAGQILVAIKEANAATLDDFNLMVYEAYDKKGWSRRIGRPLEGDVPAPVSVKVYVSTIRAAYRLGVNPIDYGTIDTLRKAIRSARSTIAAAEAASAPKPEPIPEQVQGVTVEGPTALTGSLWHDAIVLWENLPEAAQSELEEKVRKLVAAYTRKAPPALRLAA